jgi:hypothetical protein
MIMSTQIFRSNGVSIKANTAAGASWVKKVIHPPSAKDEDYHGTPFKGNSSVALLELRGESDIPPVFTYNSGTLIAPVIETLNPSTLLFLSGSGGRVGAYAFMRIAPNTYVQQTDANIPSGTPIPALPAALTSGYDFLNNYNSDFQCHRIGYKSNTFYLNATGFNNQGIVCSAKFKPDLYNTATSAAVNGVRNNSMTAHQLWKSLNPQQRRAFVDAVPKRYRIATARTTASAPSSRRSLEEDFEVLSVTDRADQLSIPISDFTLQMLNFGESQATLGVIPGGGVSIVGLLPDTISDVQMISPTSSTRQAKEGDYVVQTWSEDVNLFSQAPRVNNQTGGQHLTECFLTWYNPTSNTHLYYNLMGTSQTAGIDSYCDIPWTAHDWSYTMFQGLTVPSGSTISTTGVPYISIKTILGLEVQPRISSSMRPFMEQLPFPDDAAIEIASVLIREKPDSLPAAANDLGQIFDSITNYAPKVFDFFKGIFSGGSGDKSESKPAKSDKKAPGANSWFLGDLLFPDKKSKSSAKPPSSRPRKPTPSRARSSSRSRVTVVPAKKSIRRKSGFVSARPAMRKRSRSRSMRM